MLFGLISGMNGMCLHAWMTETRGMALKQFEKSGHFHLLPSPSFVQRIFFGAFL